jgi:hypothetical protein
MKCSLVGCEKEANPKNNLDCCEEHYPELAEILTKEHNENMAQEAKWLYV